MFIYEDTLYYSPKYSQYYTSEYIKNFAGGATKDFTKVENKWEVVYNHENIINCTYEQLFRPTDNIILCNNIINYGNGIEDLELCNGTDYDEESDEYIEVYQYYIIDEITAHALEKHTDEIVYQHNELGLHILGVTHFGTSWDYVPAQYRT